MPKLEIRATGSGNYTTQTILVNLKEVAKALYRSPLYIIKYFAYELSTSIHVKSDLYIIKGVYSQEKFQDLLDGFIKQFVLCRYCENPETELNKTDNDEITQTCCACGKTKRIGIDSHRLVKFILRNWSENDKYTNKYDPITNQIFEDEQINDDDLTSSTIDYEQFISLIQKKNLNDSNSIDELINEAKKLNMIDKLPFDIAKDLFTDDILEEIDTYEMLFHQLCQNNNEGQESLLNGIEVIINRNREKLLNNKRISKIFYKLYDKNIITEETFLNWYEKESKQLIQKQVEIDIYEYAKEFIEWLRTADEELS
ncbi:unnamed protein product [Adineta steineri]|uniref:Eukaryotic translation initiation factor 5 n=1 Tax=Adineta steineri TaxID=433720 RepID=A0A813UWU1_9BILA|nr:unnamed protein product [Adineta steineri]CAF1070784.1 unnamed protein product [Adineta steineri]